MVGESGNSRLTRRQEQKTATRQRLLRVAGDLFAEKGYHKATMRELAVRAGVGLGTIFSHFPDKTTLLAAAFREEREAVLRTAFATLPPASFKDQLLHLVRHLYSYYAQRPAFSRALIQELLFLGDRHGEEVDLQILTLIHRLAELGEAAVTRGEVRGTVDCQETALAIWSFFFVGLLQGLKETDFDVKVQVARVERMLDQHLVGIGVTGKAEDL
jgi:AcrR family transcriptional regulator